jgi:hypothetical protein
VENERACRFFRTFGFRNHGEPTLVAGMRDAAGQRLHQQIMVRDARTESG